MEQSPKFYLKVSNVSQYGAPEYDDILNSDLPKEEKVKQIKMRGQQYEDEINREHLKDLGRIGLGGLVSAASFHPILNVPYVGTGIGGAMYDLGQGLIEGDTLPELAKRAGRGFVIGETVGAIPYVGKSINKMSGGKIGNSITNSVNKLVEKTGTLKPIRALNSMLSQDVKIGENPFFNPFKANGEILYDSANPLHQQQLKIIENTNPAPDSYHTWIRSADDIYNFEDTLKPPQFDPDFIGNDFDPSYSWDMAQDAIKNGKITIHSSYPIETGTFVTPSEMEAMQYSGNGKIYSKEVPLSDVAWIDERQGQYAPPDLAYLYDDIVGEPLKYTGEYVINNGIRYPEVSFPINEYARNMSDLETYIGQNKLQHYKDIIKRYYPEYNIDVVLDKTGKPRIINKGN